MKSRSAWFENGTEKARKLKNEKSKRLIKSAILGNADKKEHQFGALFYYDCIKISGLVRYAVCKSWEDHIRVADMVLDSMTGYIPKSRNRTKVMVMGQQ